MKGANLYYTDGSSTSKIAVLRVQSRIRSLYNLWYSVVVLCDSFLITLRIISFTPRKTSQTTQALVYIRQTQKRSLTKADCCILTIWYRHKVLVYCCTHQVAVKSEHEIVCEEGTFWQKPVTYRTAGFICEVLISAKFARC